MTTTLDIVDETTYPTIVVGAPGRNLGEGAILLLRVATAAEVAEIVVPPVGARLVTQGEFMVIGAEGDRFGAALATPRAFARPPFTSL